MISAVNPLRVGGSGLFRLRSLLRRLLSAHFGDFVERFLRGILAVAVTHLGDDDGVAHRHRAAGNDLEEDALAREDAVAR